MVRPDLEQRLSAVLAADAVQFSRHMYEDCVATVHALDAARETFRKQIAAHRGRTVDTAGDSILAVFDTAIGAMSAALGIQSDLGASAPSGQDPPMRFRIGIHLGDLLEKPDGSVYGDGVNIACRLQALADAGGIAVSGAIHDAVVGKVSASFVDHGSHSVKNFDSPIHAYRVSSSAAVKGIQRPSAGAAERSEKPTIAVLPFVNLSGDPEQEFFADGMCEDIVTLLSSVSSFFVISRSSTFAYKNKSMDVRVIARDLDVRYVVQGSVRKAGQRIRVAAQFIDAERGTHIWAENYDRALEDIFAVQDEVARAIVAATQARILDAEFSFVSRRPPDAIGAWGNVVRAKVKLFAFRRRDLDQAEPFARKAIEIDPEYGAGHAVLAQILAVRSFNRWCDDWYGAAKESAACCARALELAPNDAGVLTDIGASYWTLGRALPALATLERSNALNPNSAMNCAQYGLALACIGRAEEGIVQVARAFALSPQDPLEYLFHGNLAYAEFFAGKYEQARQSAQRALDVHPNLVHVMLLFAGICVRLGRWDEGRAMLVKVKKLGGSWAIENLFRPRTEGTVWRTYTDAIREMLDSEPSA